MTLENPVRTVLLGMSGGIDSSVSVHILKEQGYEVTGLMLLTASMSRETVIRAQNAASRLGIPMIIDDLRQEFDDFVVKPFVQAYKDGMTPNPCITCNPGFKFRRLADAADRHGIGRIATGHFARVVTRGGDKFIARGKSEKNDQSYFLYRLGREIRERLIFPLGDLYKEEVREKAALLGLDYTGVKSSQEACFICGDLREWLSERLPEMEQRGPAYDIRTGKLLGTHSGSRFFTIGQRKGHGIATGNRAYIARIDHATNSIYLGSAEDCLVDRVEAEEIALGCVDEGQLREGARLLVRTRSSMVPAEASVSIEEGRLVAKFDKPVWASAPGQSMVCYEGEVIACGGRII